MLTAACRRVTFALVAGEGIRDRVAHYLNGGAPFGRRQVIDVLAQCLRETNLARPLVLMGGPPHAVAARSLLDSPLSDAADVLHAYLLTLMTSEGLGGVCRGPGPGACRCSLDPGARRGVGRGWQWAGGGVSR